MAPEGARPPPPRLVRRLIHKADFVRLLDVSAKERSAHFAVHYLAASPQTSQKKPARVSPSKLSTDGEQVLSQVVDNSPSEHWVGCVVPKRHARRSVTRTLLKRQIRSAVQRHAGGLAHGLWLVRLRSPFAPKFFVSAASAALVDAVRDELDALLARAVSRASA